MKLESFTQIFEKYINIKFNENMYSGSKIVLCERTAMTKLIVAFRNFAKKHLKIALRGGHVRPSASPPVDGIMSATKPFAGFS
jgi:hypothetical protein